MIVFVLLSVTFAQQSLHIGQIKYSLQPGQTFEHQFFRLDNVHSIDLYFPDPPNRLVDDNDLNCYWSFQQIGIRQIANWPALSIETQNSNGDILCLGDTICYLTHSNQLYAIAAKLITQPRPTNQIFQFQTILAVWTLPQQLSNAKIIDFSERGFIALYSKTSNQFELRDISKITTPRTQHSDEFLSRLILTAKSFAINHNTLILYACTNEIQVISYFDINDIQELKPIPHSDCKQLKIHDNILYMATEEQIIVWDISDPFWTKQLAIIKSQTEIFDVNATHLLIIEKERQLRLLRITNFSFEVLIESNLLMESSATIGKLSVQEYGAILISKNSVFLIDLTKTPALTSHQQARHQMNLTMSEHFLNSTGDEIHIVKDKMIQISSGVIRMYSAANESYSLVCQAPFLKDGNRMEMNFFGVIRSESQCSEIRLVDIEEGAKEIVRIEHDKQSDKIKCLYLFSLSLSVGGEWKVLNQAIMMVVVLCIVVVCIVGNKVLQWCKKRDVNESLKKFEEYNSDECKNAKIRITHYISESDDEDKLKDSRGNEEDLA